MKAPARRSLRTIRIVSLALLVAALSGCLSTEASITLERDGSGSIELAYEIDRIAWETGVFDDSDLARAVPVTEHDFAAAAEQIVGLRLRSHRTTVADDRVSLVARLDFDTPQALARLLGTDSVAISVDERSGRWRQVIAAGEGSQSDEARLLAEGLEGYTLRFELDPPEPIASTNGEIVRAADAAAFTLTLAEIVTAQEPIVWEVAW